MQTQKTNYTKTLESKKPKKTKTKKQVKDAAVKSTTVRHKTTIKNMEKESKRT